MREFIVEKMKEVAAQVDCELVENMTDDQVLLESGLDSLGFAILVALLEEELEFDPFVELDHAVYPQTLGEFVAVYKRN